MFLCLRKWKAKMRQQAPPEHFAQPAWERRELDGSEVRRALDGGKRKSIKRIPIAQEMVDLG
jgi:hypothetical protein